MSIKLHVSLLSGRTVLVEIKLDADVETIKQHAQSALEVGHGRFFDSRGSALEGSMIIRDCGLQTGDALMLQLQPVSILPLKGKRAVPECGKFAAILGDGSVVTWGHANLGGDSSAMQDRLRHVRQIQASSYAFAAILGDGSVVTWGPSNFGGDGSAVQDRLRNVQQIQASDQAFAAILTTAPSARMAFPHLSVL